MIQFFFYSGFFYKLLFSQFWFFHMTHHFLHMLLSWFLISDSAFFHWIQIFHTWFTIFCMWFLYNFPFTIWFFCEIGNFHVGFLYGILMPDWLGAWARILPSFISLKMELGLFFIYFQNSSTAHRYWRRSSVSSLSDSNRVWSGDRSTFM